MNALVKHKSAKTQFQLLQVSSTVLSVSQDREGFGTRTSRGLDLRKWSFLKKKKKKTNLCAPLCSPISLQITEHSKEFNNF